MITDDKTEGEVFSEILERMLSCEALKDMDKSQSSVVYNMLSPVALELTGMYIEMRQIAQNSAADTASLENMIRIAAQRGVLYRQAEKSVLEAQILSDPPLTVGDAFSLSGMIFRVTECLGGDRYALTCDDAGSAGNLQTGDPVYLDRDKTVSSAKILGILTRGTDAETLEQLRERYYACLAERPFAGNKASYRQSVLALDAVGACKVERPVSEFGGGDVMLTVMSRDYGVVSDADMKNIVAAIDPMLDGAGDGIVPIGHTVLIQSVEPETVLVCCTVETEEQFDRQQIAENAQKALEQCAGQVCREWAETGSGTLRRSSVMASLLSVSGVADISSLTMQTEGGEVFTVKKYDGKQIPVLQAVMQ